MNFIEKAKQIHRNNYSYSKVNYINSKTKVCIICNTCHNDFWQTPAHHLQGNGCPYCNRGKNFNISKEQFNEKIKNIFNGKITCKNFKNMHEKIIAVCYKHGEFSTYPEHLLKGKACKKCRTEKLTKTTEQFIEEAKKVHGDKYNYSLTKYINSKTKVCIICPFHGEFWQTPSNHLYYSCPHCRESKGERKIRVWLKKNNINYKQHYYFDDCKYKERLPFDFYIPDLNLLIEFQGKQHYKPVEIFGGEKVFEEYKIRDKIKKDYCEKNNIKLLEIKYDEDVETILKENLL